MKNNLKIILTWIYSSVFENIFKNKYFLISEVCTVNFLLSNALFFKKIFLISHIKLFSNYDIKLISTYGVIIPQHQFAISVLISVDKNLYI